MSGFAAVPSLEHDAMMEREFGTKVSPNGRLERAMAKCWPVGSEVRFRIQSNHVRPSEGVVRSHQGRFGQIVIRMASGHVVRIPPSGMLS